MFCRIDLVLPPPQCNFFYPLERRNSMTSLAPRLSLSVLFCLTWVCLSLALQPSPPVFNPGKILNFFLTGFGSDDVFISPFLTTGFLFRWSVWCSFSGNVGWWSIRLCAQFPCQRVSSPLSRLQQHRRFLYVHVDHWQLHWWLPAKCNSQQVFPFQCSLFCAMCYLLLCSNLSQLQSHFCSFGNSHYVFLSYSENSKAEVIHMRDRLLSRMSALKFSSDEIDQWKQRLHFVPTPVKALNNWIPQLLQNWTSNVYHLVPEVISERLFIGH